MQLSDFANQLLQYRRRLGFTQAQVASAASYSVALVARWERGDRKPRDRDAVIALGRALQLRSPELDGLLTAAGFAPTEKPPAESALARLAAQLPTLNADLAEIKRLLTSDVSALVRENAAVQPIVEALVAHLHQSGYLRHLNQFQGEKTRIAEWIVRNALQAGDRLALDTGSTIIEIAHRIARNNLGIDSTFTNNLLAALILLSRDYSVHLAGGSIQATRGMNAYGAMFGPWSEEMLLRFEPRVTIVGTSGISYERGLYAPTDEDKNWKHLLLTTALKHHTKIVIPVDFSKFMYFRAYDRLVFEQREIWEELRDSILIVTAGTPDGANNAEQFLDLSERFGAQLVNVDLEQPHSQI